MHEPRKTARLVAATVAASFLLGGVVPAAHADAGFTTQALFFDTGVASGSDPSCRIEGDLYLPSDASASHPVPAIMATNGWGGSKADLAGIGKAFAVRGYAFLAYSGLGWGGSSCTVSVNDPEIDGRAASRLVDYLGGDGGIAYLDSALTTAAPPLQTIVRDAQDHDGTARPNDPRVGMVGISYGAGTEFAAASVDHRIDTIVPMATWNDLAYSLAPNGTSTTSGVSSSTPGAGKTVWAASLLAFAAGSSLSRPINPTTVSTCPGLAQFFCDSVVTGLITGAPTASQIDAARAHSVSSYVSEITVPVLLGQGQNDTLFDLNEAIATYTALKAQGTPVSMIWHEFGHDGDAGVTGEFTGSAPDFDNEYLSARILTWFDRYLKDLPVSTGPEFAYFRDWIGYSGSAAPAYASTSSYPVEATRSYMLSGTGALTADSGAVTADRQSFLTAPGGVPTSIDPVHAFGSVSAVLPEDLDLPGTTARWTSAPLGAPLDVVGSPTLKLKVDAPTAALTQSSGDTGKLVLFVKLEDVDASGSATLIHKLVAPVRIPDVGSPFTVTLPAIAHRFATDHRLRIVVAGGSSNFRGNSAVVPVSIAGGVDQVLTLPVTN
ncbi:MAG: CocE/NonD family hydrolase [Microbacterium enclense]